MSSGNARPKDVMPQRGGLLHEMKNSPHRFSLQCIIYTRLIRQIDRNHKKLRLDLLGLNIHCPFVRSNKMRRYGGAAQ